MCLGVPLRSVSHLSQPLVWGLEILMVAVYERDDAGNAPRNFSRYAVTSALAGCRALLAKALVLLRLQRDRRRHAQGPCNFGRRKLAGGR